MNTNDIEKITWISPYFDLVLNEIPKETKSLLDVGAGNGIFGLIVKKTRNLDKIDCVEPFNYDLHHFDTIYKQTWSTYWAENNSKSQYDVIICLETIEHMTKDKVEEFLYEARQMAKKIIIVTPYYFQQQNTYDGNELQKHQSLVTIDDLKSHGYKIRLIGTWKITKLLSFRVFYHYKLKTLLRIFGIKPTNIMGIFDKR